MPQLPRQWRRAAAPAALLVLLGVGLSCRDTIAPVPMLEPEIRQNAAPPPYSATFGVGSPNDPKDTMELNSFSERRKVRVTIAGNLTATHKDNGGTRTTTPSGYLSGDCTGRVYVVFAGNQGSYMPACSSAGPFTKEFVAQGQGRAFRDGYGGGGGWYCDAPKQDQFCWNFSGTQQVTVEVIDYPGRMTAYDGSTEKTTIPAAKSLWFAWTPVPNQSDIPKATYNWWFVTADSGRVIQNAVPYGYDAQWGYVPKSGTMYVNVAINGVNKTLSRYIHVGPVTLTLTASPTKVHAGDTVHFTADIKPDSTTVSGLRWFWFPEQPVVGLRANVTKDPDAAAAGTASLVQTTDSVEIGACAGYRTCDHIVYARGGMRVHAVVAGVAKHAERDVDLRHVKIQLTAKPQRVIKGKRVYFTATASTAGGSPAAVGISQWTWQDASGVSTPGCAIGYPDCDQLVFRSGTMRAIGTVNGSTDTAYVSVSAFDCDTTGVPELDDVNVRESLLNWYQRRLTLGKEGLMLVHLAGDGGYTTTEVNTPQATLCSTGYPDPPLTSAQLQWLAVHPHLREKIGPGIPLPPECDLQNCTRFGTGWYCTSPPALGQEFTEPVFDDWRVQAEFPDRNAILRPDSVFAYKATNDLAKQKPDSTIRKSTANWRSCVAQPI